MSPSELFIKRPIMTTLVMLAILFFGVQAYRSLPVSDLPNVDFPTISVSASLPGASPETMAASVATPLERQFSTIAGIDSMSSSNSLGSTNITIQFSLDRNIDAAAQDVQSAIGKASRRLPRGMPNPPSYQKVNPADSPILLIALGSDTLPLSTVNEYADTQIAQRISMVSGVAQVNIFGSKKRAVRIYLDPQKLVASKLGIDEVANAVDRGNVNTPTGILYGPDHAYTIKATGQLLHAPDFAQMVIAYRNGSPVRLQDLGRVIEGVENDKSLGWFNGSPSVMLAIQKQPGTNTVEIVDNVKKLVDDLQGQLPAAMYLTVMIDRSESIRASVQDVKHTLMLTICLVIAVIFLFLRNGSATLIPSLALPISLIGAFGMMYLLNFSMDNMSLLALTLAVGFVVDDAIVMLENIVRRMENGESRMEASLAGSKEIGFTIVSMTISLVAVFIPVLFMQGVIGRLLHEFAVTISIAIIISGFVSLSLTPMLCSRFLTPHDPHAKGNILYRATERIFEGWLALYDWTLRVVLRLKLLALLLSFALIFFTAHLFMVIPKGFIPNEDIGQLNGTIEGVQGISFEALSAHQAAAAEIIRNHPSVAAMYVTAQGGNTARMFMRLKPRKERIGAEETMAELRPQLAKIPGIQVYLQMPPPIRIGGNSSKSQYQFTLQTPDTEDLFAAATNMEVKMRDLPQLQDVTSDLQIKNPEVNVDIDRDKAATLGVSPQQIEDALYTAYGTRTVSSIYAPSNQYDVIMQLDSPFQADPSSLKALYVKSDSGALVPLESVANLSTSVGPLSINHLGQLNAVTLSYNLKPGVALGEANEAIKALAAKELPATVSSSFQGTAQIFESSIVGLGMLLLMAIVVIYLVLGILYESFIHPITILSGLPSAGLGALLTLRLFNLDLSLYAFVGIIMLVGIVKKNAIMMIDFALDAQRNGNKPPEQAIYDGALIRFRPIMMTTMAALVGTLPIALGLGTGAESRRPLGLAVVGGLVVSQILTLYLTPVYYIYMEKLSAFFRGKKKQGPATPTDDLNLSARTESVSAERVSV